MATVRMPVWRPGPDSMPFHATRRLPWRGGYVPAIWTFVVSLLISLILLGHYWTRSRTVVENIMAETGNTVLTVLESTLRSRAASADMPRLQFLMHELTGKFNVRFIAITTMDGLIVAHSDEEKAGTILADGAGRWIVPRSMGDVAPRRSPRWLLSSGDADPLFLVYRLLSADGSDATGKPLNQLCAFLGMNTAPLRQAVVRDRQVAFLGAGSFLAFGAVVSLCVLVVTRLRRSRRSQQEVEAMMAELALALPDGLMFFDADGRLTSINRSALELLRLGDRSDMKRPADLDRLRERLPDTLTVLIRTLHDSGRLPDTEIRLREVDDPLYVSVRGGNVSNGRGGSAGHLVLLHDISDVRRLEREIRRREKLAAIGNLAAGVAHELRNPLSSIKGYAIYFGGRFPEGSADREAARVMVAETERLNRAISELIGLAAPTDIQARPTRLEDLVEDVVKLIANDASGQGVSVSVASAHDLPSADIDPDRVKQVILNVCLNAIDAMPDGGTLRLCLSTEDEGGRFVRVDVSDSGVGIAEEDQAHIFDPYFTTKGQGTGLGLAIVHKIMEAHGGRVGVQSRKGCGATFTLLFPCASADDGDQR